MRRAVLPLVVVLGLAGCESSQQTSRRLEKSGAKSLLGRKGLQIGAQNAGVKVERTTILQDKNGIAAVVELRNTSPRDEIKVPIAITLKDASGKKVYANNIPGLDPSLTSVPLLPARKAAFWVNNQILGNGTPKKLDVQVGQAKGSAGKLPEVEVTQSRLDHDADGPFVAGVIHNHGKQLLRRLTVYCIARKGDKVVAAGRAVVDKLPPDPTKKPTRFSVYFIGNPAGAKLEFAAPPVSFPQD